MHMPHPSTSMVPIERRQRIVGFTPATPTEMPQSSTRWWIPVGFRSPSHSRLVQVYIHDQRTVGVAIYAGGGFRHPMFRTLILGVTHWAELLQAPVIEDDADTFTR